jgi:hypothetical protein
MYEISGFLRGEIEVFTVLEFYASLASSLLPTFRDSLSIPSSRVKQSNLSSVKSQKSKDIKLKNASSLDMR